MNGVSLQPGMTSESEKSQLSVNLVPMRVNRTRSQISAGIFHPERATSRDEQIREWLLAAKHSRCAYTGS